MIAAWMLYATVLGALLGGAAGALERLASARRLATRWLWLGAMAGTVVAPTLLVLRPTPVAPAPVAATTRAPVPVASPQPRAADGRRLPLWQRTDLARLNGLLLVGWASASAVFAMVLLGAALAQRRASRAWAARNLDGVSVLVAEDVGPLVLGLWRLRVVLPEWALLRTEAERHMMLAHEEEHRRARDPNLLLLGVLALVLSPWNLALYWQIRRLRLAIETDCDRRVLSTGVDVGGYGNLLLGVGSRFATQSLLTATAFSEMPSLLERRIDAMTAPAPRHPVARAVTLGALAAGALALACAAPRPAPIRPTAATARIFSPLGDWRPGPMSTREPYTNEQMTAAIARYFPEILQGDTTHLPIRFVIDAEGRVVATSSGARSRPMVPYGRVSYGQTVDAAPGTYGPGRVRIEVTWLRSDSVSDSTGVVGFTTVTMAPRATSDTGATPEQLVPQLVRARPELLRGLGARDTAFVWFVMDLAEHVARFGRAGSAEAAVQDAHVPLTPASGYWWHAISFPPGGLAEGTLTVAVWWPRP